MSLRADLAGIALRNPVMLAAGTAAYGAELMEVAGFKHIGGLVTKAVSLSPREGAPAPRVAEFPGGMINAVGLANPGVEAVATHHLPRLARELPDLRALVNVVGFGVDEFAQVVERLASVQGISGFELNVSCPNVKAGGMEFGADPAALSEVVRSCRAATGLPIFVKLSPALPDIARTATHALEHGASGITVVNTWPGLLIDVATRRPALGFGTGGVSGPGLLPVGVLATWKVFKATGAPILGIGGVASANDALQYVLAGAAAVGIGTAGLKNPRLPDRVAQQLDEWGRQNGVADTNQLRGQLQWP